MSSFSEKKNDNRNYDYSGQSESERADYNHVVKLVSQGSSVIDLACGEGSLIQKLVKEKNVSAKGIELSKSGIEICKSKGLDVQEGRIDTILPFKDNEFAYSICHISIQMVTYPEILLSEMKRISKYQVVSFPNFAFYKNRLDMLFKGRMPKPMIFGYKWYSTGHIHQLSLKDFYELVNDIGGLRIEKLERIRFSNPIKDYLVGRFPNIFNALTVLLIKKL